MELGFEGLFGVGVGVPGEGWRAYSSKKFHQGFLLPPASHEPENKGTPEVEAANPVVSGAWKFCLFGLWWPLSPPSCLSGGGGYRRQEKRRRAGCQHLTFKPVARSVFSQRLFPLDKLWPYRGERAGPTVVNAWQQPLKVWFEVDASPADGLKQKLDPITGVSYHQLLQ